MLTFRIQLWDNNHLRAEANISSSIDFGDTTASITTPEKSSQRPPPPEEISLDYEAPSQTAQRDKLLQMLQNPGHGSDNWEPSFDDDDDASPCRSVFRRVPVLLVGKETK